MSTVDPRHVQLGASPVHVSAIGIGTWQWGDRLFWGYGGATYSDEDLAAAFRAAIDGGIDFFDTAEVYGRGRSETLLGQFARQSGAAVVIATKFMPYPWRLRAPDLRHALEASLRRLGVPRVDLYQIHWPLPPRAVEVWANALADAIEAGLVRAAGVSNFSADQLRRAHDVFTRRGIPLASQQVEYSLLRRDVERNGVAAACRERGITLIAYSPLAQGLLTGRYTIAAPPPGIRRLRYARLLSRIEPLLGLMGEIGQQHGGRPPAEVALNWLVAKGALPIPGVKRPSHVAAAVGALSWQLSAEEVAALDVASDRIAPAPRRRRRE